VAGMLHSLYALRPATTTMLYGPLWSTDTRRKTLVAAKSKMRKKTARIVGSDRGERG
jgi:hypothetical protein